MNRSYNYKLHSLLAAILVSFSCTTDNPTVIQLPDKTPPSGYIVNPLDGSSDAQASQNPASKAVAKKILATCRMAIGVSRFQYGKRQCG